MNPTQDPREQRYPPPAGGQGGYQGYPPPPPGYPPQGPGYLPPGYPRPAPRNLSLSELFQRWQVVIMGRSVPTFDEQKPAASWPNIWLGLAIYAVIRGIFGAINTAIYPTVRIGTTVVSAGSPVSSFFGSVIGAFIGFFVAAGILYLLAKMFNGTGTFMTYAFLLSLIWVPLGSIGAVVGLIPVIGAILSLLIGIFEIYLAILATASAHRLPMDRATWVVLIPVIVAVVLGFILLAIAAAVLVNLGY
jgi:hypothetical protein